MHATRPTTSHPPWLGLDYTIGRLETKDAEQDRRITKLEENRDKDKAELDRIKTWGERIALLVVLYALTAGMHVSAPIAGPVIGAMARGAIAGLRGG
jgi:hypothetical protein